MQAVPVLLPHLATPICEKTTTSRLGFSCFPRDYVTLIPLTRLNPTAFHILQIPKDTTTTVHFIHVYKVLPFPLILLNTLYSNEQLVLTAVPLNSSLNCVYRKQLCEGDAFPFRWKLRETRNRRGKSELLEILNNSSLSR